MKMRYIRSQKALNLSRTAILVLLLAYGLSYLLFYPQAIFIFDELSYFNRGFAFASFLSDIPIADSLSQQAIDLTPFPYPLGTAAMLGLLIFLFGLKGAYLLSPLMLLGSFLLIYQTLKECNAPTVLSLLVFFYPPCLILSRTVMSGLPSLFLLSLFGYIYLCKPKDFLRLLVLGVLATLSIWFRETNILLFALPLLALVFQAPKQLFPLALGGILGLLPRLLSAYWVYGDPFFIKDPNVAFSLSNIFDNLPLYALTFTVFFPLAWCFIFRFKTRLQGIFNTSILLFLLLYLLYAYNGSLNSGIKALILGPRFFIPIIPFFIYSVAFADLAWVNRLLQHRFCTRVLPLIFATGLIAFNVILYQVEAPARDFQERVQAQIVPDSTLVILDFYSDMFELANPILLRQLKQIDIADLHSVHGNLPEDKNCLYIKVSRYDSDSRKAYTERIHEMERLHLQTLKREVLYEQQNGYQLLEVIRLSN